MAGSRQKIRQARHVNTSRKVPNMSFSHRLSEGLLTISLALCTFYFIALLTYLPTDPGWSHTSTFQIVHNAGGIVGAWLADCTLYLMGYMGYIFPMGLSTAAIGFYRSRNVSSRAWDKLKIFKIIGLVMILLAGSGLAQLEMVASVRLLPGAAGGLLGEVLAQLMTANLNFTGTLVILSAFMLCGVTLLTGISWLCLLDIVGGCAWWLGLNSVKQLRQVWQHYATRRAQIKTENQNELKPPVLEMNSNSLSQTVNWSSSLELELPPEEVEPPTRTSFFGVTQDSHIEVEQTWSHHRKHDASKTTVKAELGETPTQRLHSPVKKVLKKIKDSPLPILSLLDSAPPAISRGYSHTVLEAMSREVELILQDFGVTVKVVAVHPGPVITRFELQLAPGIKVSKISGLSKDLARSLSVTSVRVVEVIPGKSYVGLEIPNNDRQSICLSEILSSTAYEQARSSISLALGKDIAGHAVVVDLAKMPHLLVAGTTGAGKSVGLNAMILSILFKATPEQVRLIMVDPKMLELSVYEGIPHLLCPVVTDMKEAANALRWCVAEMERRYKLMASLGVRNLAGFNQKISEAQTQGSPILDPLAPPGVSAQPLQSLPYIVVIIDEFADMMMIVGKKVEELIARIAQKARAAGIHMILATQRPSVDVITGLIKANIPTRIAFQVSSKIDSRTILDQSGAEQLLGQGDLLYLAPGSGVPVRVHGAYVSDQEVHRVALDWKERGEADYLEEILQESNVTAASDGIYSSDDPESDPLYDQAVQIVLQTRRASISGIQRRLKIGYNRAARLIEAMEHAGLVGPMENNGNREIFAASAVED